MHGVTFAFCPCLLVFFCGIAALRYTAVAASLSVTDGPHGGAKRLDINWPHHTQARVAWGRV